MYQTNRGSNYKMQDILVCICIGVLVWTVIIWAIKAAIKHDKKETQDISVLGSTCCNCGQSTNGYICARCGCETLKGKLQKQTNTSYKWEKIESRGVAAWLAFFVVRYLLLDKTVRNIDYLLLEDTLTQFVFVLGFIFILVCVFVERGCSIKAEVIRKNHIKQLQKLKKNNAAQKISYNTGRFCPRCGNAIGVNTVFCAKCGTRVTG
jgi:hypothetical protein